MALPGGKATGQVVDLLEAFAGQYLCSGPAASAGGSIGNYRFLQIQFI
jgi:hypothetical protein